MCNNNPNIHLMSENESIIREYDSRYDITYVIDTNRTPNPGDKVLDIDGDTFNWTEGVNDIIGVIIEEIEGHD